MLKWTIQELMKHDEQPLHFSTTLDVKADLQDRDPEILDVSPIQVSGDVLYDRGDFLVSVNLTGTLVVPSTRSLKPVTMPQNFTFSEIYLTDEGHADQYEDGEILMPLEESELNLLPAVEDHLLLSIPMQVLTPEEVATGDMPAGDEWEVLAEDEYKKRIEEGKKADNPFAKLKGMFPDQDKS
ncbi:metal-binding protein [Lacticaseibacillus chiayiensis]|uniref:Metal-binding protein n=1 Tax=Lacticaseibacillus chiayiensis TaxID=2100821 RepID=A0A4Q1UC44_9LACO|nr:YceD family protein [Lacticaseibacillus chiayiensis]RXT29589.1 metal-binding protein [Lacticaseibacillus chiayiensis]UYN55401.1 YceD family protein [Lacticaseibacillus chiayiensis]